jgi:hypothetical protein
MIKTKPILLFFIAAFSMTQIKIVGYIGISELLMLIMGPFLLIKKWHTLKQHGFMTLILLSFCWAVSAIVTDLYRGTSFSDILRGVASPLMILAMI